MECGEVGGGGFVVAGGQATPLLELVDAAFDGVALPVSLAVEGWRAPPEPAPPLAVRGLVRGLRDDCSDSAPSQVAADRPRGVGLVGQDRVGGDSGPADRSGHSYPVHDLLECRCVTCLAQREDDGEGPAAAVGGEVNLRGQSAAGPSEGMVVRLAGRSPF